MELEALFLLNAKRFGLLPKKFRPKRQAALSPSMQQVQSSLLVPGFLLIFATLLDNISIDLTRLPKRLEREAQN